MRKYPHNSSLDHIESDYWNGICTQTQYEQYCFVWRNSNYRFSSNYIQYESKEHYLKPIDELIELAERLYP